MRFFSMNRWAASVLVSAVCGSAGVWAAPVIALDTAAVGSSDSNGTSEYSQTDVSPSGKRKFQSSYGMTGFASSMAYADELGAYGVNVAAGGKATGRSGASLLYTLTNTSATAQAISMSFDVFAGSLLNTTYGGSWSAGEYLRSEYLASISVGASTLFSSGAVLTTNSSGSTLALSGTRLNDGGDDGADAHYGWTDGSYSLSLGTLGAGQSLQVLAAVKTWALADTGMYRTDDYMNDLMKGACVIVDTPDCVEGAAIANYGDPASFGTSPGDPLISAVRFNLAAVTANDVPEPATSGLLVLALGVLAWQTKRQRG